jgi:hypothetical protein
MYIRYNKAFKPCIPIPNNSIYVLSGKTAIIDPIPINNGFITICLSLLRVMILLIQINDSIKNKTFKINSIVYNIVKLLYIKLNKVYPKENQLTSINSLIYEILDA